MSDRKAAADPSHVASDGIAVILVNWKCADYCLECLATLRLTQGVKWHLFIVDNGSPDGSADRLKNLGNDVTTIALAANTGWTGGNNAGIERALGDGYDHIFLLNPDATVEPSTLNVLKTYYQSQNDHPVIGPIQIDPNTNRIDFMVSHLNEDTMMPEIRDYQIADAVNFDTAVDTHYIKGAGLFINRVHIEKVGFFDPRFFLYYDETEWCYRARESGFPVRVVKDARIWHVGSVSFGGFDSPLSLYFLTRNSLLFAHMHLNRRSRFRHMRDVFYHGCALTRKTGRISRIVEIFLGRDSLLKAYRRAVFDYALRQFGDCPTSIRDLPKAIASVPE